MKMYNKKGFTLIELLIYIALTTFFLSGTIAFLWNIVYIKEKTIVQNAKIYKSLTIHGKANYIANYSSTTQDFMDNLNFTNVAKTDRSTNDSLNIKVELNDSESAWELPKPDLEGRSLLMDLTRASLTSTGDNLLNISIRNSKDTLIVVDKIYLEWHNISETPNVTEIQIDGGDIEWSGNEGSETTVDINNVELAPDTLVEIDYIKFDSDMGGGALTIKFIMQDGSRASGKFDLMTQEGVGGTGPTPCSNWCINQEYSYGTCEQNIQQCMSNNGTYAPEADSYCTGGESADTCCCMED